MLTLTVRAADEATPAKMPWESAAFTLETGVLWEVGTGTPIPYRLVPVQLSWRSARAFGWDLKDGAHLLVRHRLTFITDWVQHGPESLYVAVSGSPSIEWWNPAGTWALTGGAGGGLGLIDSRAVKGAQGQDFTFNWFMRGGIEHVVTENVNFNAGIMYQHMSNGGQTEPNPGIDALGFLVGFSWKY